MKRTMLVLAIAWIAPLALVAADANPPPPASPPVASGLETQPAADLDQAEEQAGIELAVAKIKLELVRAKKDLRAGQTDSAAQRARLVLALAGSLPAEIDTDDYTLPAEGILSRAGVTLPPDRGRDARPASNKSAPASSKFREDLSTDALEAELERRQAGRPYDAAGTADTVHVDDWIGETDDLAQVPTGEIHYPADWAQKVERRRKYAGGEIARSESWVDPQGHEWFTAIYDVSDLTYVPPDFQPTFSLDPSEDLRNALDRHALRWGYGAFGGFPSWDPNVLFPMFRAFGGMDDYAWRGPKYSREKQREVVQMIQSFTLDQPPTQAQIISMEP